MLKYKKSLLLSVCLLLPSQSALADDWRAYKISYKKLESSKLEMAQNREDYSRFAQEYQNGVLADPQTRKSSLINTVSLSAPPLVTGSEEEAEARRPYLEYTFQFKGNSSTSKFARIKHQITNSGPIYIYEDNSNGRLETDLTNPQGEPNHDYGMELVQCKRAIDEAARIGGFFSYQLNREKSGIKFIGYDSERNEIELEKGKALNAEDIIGVEYAGIRNCRALPAEPECTQSLTLEPENIHDDNGNSLITMIGADESPDGRIITGAKGTLQLTDYQCGDRPAEECSIEFTTPESGAGYQFQQSLYKSVNFGGLSLDLGTGVNTIVHRTICN